MIPTTMDRINTKMNSRTTVWGESPQIVVSLAADPAPSNPPAQRKLGWAPPKGVGPHIPGV